jgi:hypothetical protein
VSNRWTVVYAINGTIQTSDRRAKTDFENLPAALPIIMGVEPQTYKWRDGVDPHRHWGLIAQDLDAATRATGVEFGGINKSDPERWGVNYSEIVAIVWKGLREQQNEIAAAKREIEELKQTVKGNR